MDTYRQYDYAYACTTQSKHADQRRIIRERAWSHGPGGLPQSWV
jgi:hypothetical protein